MHKYMDRSDTAGINFPRLLCRCRQRLQKVHPSSTVSNLLLFDYSSVFTYWIQQLNATQLNKRKI